MVIREIVFELVEFIYSYLAAARTNGHISKESKRKYVRRFARRNIGRATGLISDASIKNVEEIDGQIFHYLDSRLFDYNFREVFLNEEYYFRPNRSDPTIVDCGSNIGLSTLYFKKIFPEAKIHAIEAHPRTFETLVKNVKSNNLSDVLLNNVAVVGNDETETLLFSAEGGDLRSTRIRDLRDGSPIKINEITVPSAKLSSLLPEHVDLLKMDIEGSEIEVLEEIEDKLWTVDQILIEYHYIPGRTTRSIGDFLSFLERAGFECRLVSENQSVVARTTEPVFAVTIFGYRHA